MTASSEPLLDTHGYQAWAIARHTWLPGLSHCFTHMATRPGSLLYTHGYQTWVIALHTWLPGLSHCLTHMVTRLKPLVDITWLPGLSHCLTHMATRPGPLLEKQKIRGSDPALPFTLNIEWRVTLIVHLFNPLTAKLFNLNFYPLELVSRWRDPQLQVSENYGKIEVNCF